MNNLDSVIKQLDAYCEHEQKIKHLCKKRKSGLRAISPKDFYPPKDNRVLESGVDDIIGGDTFADYAEYIFDYYSGEDLYED